MAFQNVLILNLMVILLSPTLSYPVYGTKRYGRSASSQHVSSWAPYQMMQQQQPQRYPVSYYELYPYSQTYSDDYYPQESYPLYYPPARTSKYEVYQAVLPYYYNDQILTRPSYGYYDTDPTVDLQEEMIQEAEREEREDAQPIGHELLYEDQTDENLDDVNAAFLQNLIMSQMYKESLDNHKSYYDDYYTGEDYGKWQDNSKDKVKPHYTQEDKDVRELKQLAKAKPKNPKMDDIHWFKHTNFRNQKDNQYKNTHENKRDSYRKNLVKLTTTTSSPDKNTFAPKRDIRGQKEEVLIRPATPVRHPFSNSVIEMMSKDDDRKRSSSVYDTIKHMLDMEKSLENVSLPKFFLN